MIDLTKEEIEDLKDTIEKDIESIIIVTNKQIKMMGTDIELRALLEVIVYTLKDIKKIKPEIILTDVIKTLVMETGQLKEIK